MRLLNSKGMSLMSVVAASAVIGAGTMVAMNLIQSGQKHTKHISKELDAVNVAQYLSGKIRNVFLDTKDPNSVDAEGKARNVAGMCEFITYQDGSSSDSKLRNVRYRILNYNKEELFPKSRWEKYLKGFRVVAAGDECKPSNRYGLCLELDEGSLTKESELVVPPAMKDARMVVQVDIDLVETNPLAENPFSKIKDLTGIETLDLKSVGYEYKVTLTYTREKTKTAGSPGTENEIRKSTITKGFIWAGELNVCHDSKGKGSNQQIAVVGTGFGDLEDRFVYAAAGFVDSDKLSLKTPLEIKEKKTIAQSGILSTNEADLADRTIQTNGNTLVFSSCNEITYQCPQKNGVDQGRKYRQMDQQYSMTYIKEGLEGYYPTKALPDVLKLAVKASFFNGNDELKASSIWEFGGQLYRPYYIDKTLRFIYANNQGEIDKDNWQKYELRINNKQVMSVDLTVHDKDNRFQSNNLCRKICTEQNDYNKESEGNTPYYLRLTNLLNTSDQPGAVTRSFVFDSTFPVACTSCHMKNCSRFGLGTFGEMKDMPTEPLDGRLPECVQHEPIYREIAESTIDGVSRLNSQGQFDTANKCIAYRRVGNNFKHFASNCGDAKKILCFNYGKHFIARKTERTQLSEVKAKFEDASDICFETGREIFERKSIDDLFDQQGNDGEDIVQSFLNDMGSNEISYVNLAHQGTFVQPLGDLQIKNMKKYAAETGLMLDEAFWVNLKTDNMSYVFAPAPLIAKKTRENKDLWAMTFNDKGTLYPIRYRNSLRNAWGNAGMLFHDARYKGVAFVKAKEPFGDDDHDKRRYLCLGKDGDILKDKSGYYTFSKGKGLTQQKGHEICHDEGGVFAPPAATAMWIRAMYMINENSGDTSFPEESSVRKGVWVALKGSYNAPKSFSIYDDTFFKLPQPDALPSDYLANDGSYFYLPEPEPEPDTTTQSTDTTTQSTDTTTSSGQDTSSKGNKDAKKDPWKKYNRMKICKSSSERKIVLREAKGGCGKGYKQVLGDELQLMSQDTNRIYRPQLIRILAKLGDKDVIHLK